MRNNVVKRFIFSSTIIATLFLFSEAASANKEVEWDGYYSAPSKRCTTYDDKQGRIKSCATKSRDCVRIKRIRDKEYSVQAYSIQAQQHTCAINSVGRAVNGILVVQIDDENPNQILELKRSNTGLKLEHKIGKDEQPVGCGAHASLQGLVLEKSNSDPEKKICFND